MQHTKGEGSDVIEGNSDVIEGNSDVIEDESISYQQCGSLAL